VAGKARVETVPLEWPLEHKVYDKVIIRRRVAGVHGESGGGGHIRFVRQRRPVSPKAIPVSVGASRTYLRCIRRKAILQEHGRSKSALGNIRGDRQPILPSHYRFLSYLHGHASWNAVIALPPTDAFHSATRFSAQLINICLKAGPLEADVAHKPIAAKGARKSLSSPGLASVYSCRA
jgi:hypothetical protein